MQKVKIPKRLLHSLPLLILLAISFLGFELRAEDAQMEVVTLNSKALRHNVLNDPSTRLIPIFSPTNNSNPVLPVIYYLPGYGNNSQSFIDNSNVWKAFTQKLADEVTPVIFVVVDGKTRWGGSQYLNSPAQGNYEDYMSKEVVEAVESRHQVPGRGIRRIIAGHSSGGFGALRLGISHHELFDGVIALSPDSAFMISHLPLVKIPTLASLPLLDVERIENGTIPAPKDGDILYALGLSAAYAPSRMTGRLGKFDWLYDDKGQFREQVWQRWLDNDPLTIVQRDLNAFGSSQQIYLEGPAQDDFKANIGAKAIYEAIKNRPSRTALYQPPGHHSSHLRERIERGMQWIFEKPLSDIKP